MITKQTAMDIALAYREVETAEDLLGQISGELAKRHEPDLRDAFGRHVGGLQLGVPSGHSSQRCFNVPWALAKPILEAHIAAQKAQISALTEKAILETTGMSVFSTSLEVPKNDTSTRRTPSASVDEPHDLPGGGENKTAPGTQSAHCRNGTENE